MISPFVTALARNGTPRVLLTRGNELVVLDYESPFFQVLYYNPARSALVQQVVTCSPAATEKRLYSRDGVDMIATREALNRHR